VQPPPVPIAPDPTPLQAVPAVVIVPQFPCFSPAAAAKVLGVVHRETLPFPNRRLFDSFEVRVALATIFRRWRPRVVLGLGDKTPLASPDHAQAVAITEAAVFYSRLSKWDDTFAGLPVHTVPQFLTYFLFAGVPSVPHGHWPLVVDIAGHLETKLEAIACYASQFPPEKAHVFPRVRAMAETAGIMAGCAAGEVLASSRMPCTTDPVGLLFPSA